MTEIAGRICLSSKSSLEYVTSFGNPGLSENTAPLSRNAQCTLYYTQLFVVSI